MNFFFFFFGKVLTTSISLWFKKTGQSKRSYKKYSLQHGFFLSYAKCERSSTDGGCICCCCCCCCWMVKLGLEISMAGGWLVGLIRPELWVEKFVCVIGLDTTTNFCWPANFCWVWPVLLETNLTTVFCWVDAFGWDVPPGVWGRWVTKTNFWLPCCVGTLVGGFITMVRPVFEFWIRKLYNRLSEIYCSI